MNDARAEIVISEQPGNGGGHRFGVRGRHQQAADLVLHDAWDARYRSCHDRNTSRECLDNDARDAFARKAWYEQHVMLLLQLVDSLNGLNAEIGNRVLNPQLA